MITSLVEVGSWKLKLKKDLCLMKFQINYLYPRNKWTDKFFICNKVTQLFTRTILTRYCVAVSAFVRRYNLREKWSYDSSGTSQNVNRHFKRAAQSYGRSFTCSHCGKAYAVNRSLWRHQKFECVNANLRYTCNLCNYKCPYQWRMARHRKKHYANWAIDRLWNTLSYVNSLTFIFAVKWITCV